MKHTNATVRRGFMDDTVSILALLSASMEDPAVLTTALVIYANVNQIPTVHTANMQIFCFAPHVGIEIETSSVYITPRTRV